MSVPVAPLVPSNSVQTAPASCADGPKNLPSIVPVALPASEVMPPGVLVTRVSPLKLFVVIVELKAKSFQLGRVPVGMPETASTATIPVTDRL